MREETQIYYYLIVFISMLYAFLRLGINKDSFIIIIIFWEGLFQYLDRLFNLENNLYNFYKIFVVLYASLITVQALFKYNSKREWNLTIIFILFSISFWVSYFLRGGEIITILSQYFYKYGMVFILFHYFKDIVNQENKREHIKQIILQVLYIQIFLSLTKLLVVLPELIKNPDFEKLEFIVGSMSAAGAGTAVVIPIVALIFYWLIKNGNFTRKDWFIVLSFLIISFASVKRQPIIFFPIFLYLLFSYVKKGISIFQSLKYVPIVLLIIYFSARLNPFFNPEYKIWGSFDVYYIIGTISEYYFGTENIEDVFNENYNLAFGRGGVFSFLFNSSKFKFNSLDELLFGKGRYQVAVGSFGRFTKHASKYGLEHTGLIGEFAALIYSIGYMGTLSLVLFAIYLIKTCGNKKLGNVLLLYFIWDFLFYYNQVVFSNQSVIIVLYIIFITIASKKLKKM